MRHLFLAAALLLTALSVVRAADLVLPDGRKFADFRVKKVMDDAILIAYRNEQGEPDAAEIPFRDLPEEVRRLYPDQGTSVSAPAAPAVPAASEPAPAAPAPAPAAPRRTKTAAPGSNEALIETMKGFGDHLTRQLAALDHADREGRAILAAQTRSRVEKSLAGFVREMDCEFVTTWESGIIIKIIGTPAGSPLRSGEMLFIADARPPAQRWFRGRFYPSAERIRCGRYGTLPYYGVAVRTAADAILTELADLAGEPLLFEPAETGGKAGEESAQVAPVQVNNIIVESRPSGADWWQRPVIIRPGGRHPKPGPKPDPKPDPKPQPGPKPDPKPLRQTGAPPDYGLLPSWAIPGKTGPSPRTR